MPQAAQAFDGESSAPSPEDATESASSGAEGVEQSLEDAIRDVLPPSEEDREAAEADADDGDSEQASPAEDAAEDGEQPQDDSSEKDDEAEDPDARLVAMLKDNDVPLSKIERFREVIAEKNRYREQAESAEKLQQDLARLEQEAQAAGMTQEQVGNWMNMPVLLNQNPEKALQMLQDFVSQVQRQTGATLPDDLREKVEKGYVDQETAERLARAEAQANRERSRAEQSVERQTQETLRLKAESIRTAVNQFDQSLRESDPDYAAKEAYLRDRVHAMRAELGRPPESPEEAVAIVKEAHKQVTERLQALRPQRKPARTISSRGGSKPATPNPANMLEAITAAVSSGD
jgi:hypothetical protein